MLFNTSVVQSSSTHVLVLFFVAWLSADTAVIFLTFSWVGFWLSGEGLDSCKDSESSHSYGVGSGKARRVGGRRTVSYLDAPGSPPREAPERLAKV